MGITLPVVTKKAFIKTKKTCELLFVGRLVEVKGVMYLCKALAKLHQDGIDFEATIIGDGPDMEKIKEYIDGHRLRQKVELPGWIDHAKLSQFFAKADIFVGPSLHEAQGLVFVEALASGVPVVASRVGGIIDAVEDGKNGLLVEPKSVNQLYEALKKLINSPKLREHMAVYAPLSIGDRYEWSTISRKYDTVFDQVSGE
jgi:glycosyltransferase involved in cell wall biosynthesis